MNWNKGQIFSIRLRDGSFALLQKLQEFGHVAIFDAFRTVDSWNDVKLEPSNVLFTCWLIKSVLNRSTISIHNRIETVRGVEESEFAIDPGEGFRKAVFWEGTEHEREIMVMGTGGNLLRHREFKNGKIHETHTKLSLDEYETVKHFEMTHLRGYPEFNERLYLCALRGTNYDPLREIAFLRNGLDIDNLVYIDIIGGQVKVSDLGYE